MEYCCNLSQKKDFRPREDAWRKAQVDEIPTKRRRGDTISRFVSLLILYETFTSSAVPVCFAPQGTYALPYSQ